MMFTHWWSIVFPLIPCIVVIVWSLSESAMPPFDPTLPRHTVTTRNNLKLPLTAAHGNGHGRHRRPKGW